MQFSLRIQLLCRWRAAASISRSACSACCGTTPFPSAGSSALREAECGDEAGGKAHKPLDESRRQPWLSTGSSLNRVGRCSPGHSLPAPNGGFVLSPVEPFSDAGTVRVVNHNWMSSDVSVRSPRLPRCFGEPFVPSLARGVGRSLICCWPASITIASLSARPPVVRFDRAPCASRARGVGSSVVTRSRPGGFRQVHPPASADGLWLVACPPLALLSCRPCSALGAASRMLLASGRWARIKTRSRR